MDVIPRYRQAFDPDSWRADGFASPEDSALWSSRSCGFACVRMILSWASVDAPPMTDLLRRGLALDAYCDRGWIHAGLVSLLGEYGVAARAVAIAGVEALPTLLTGGRPAIASVTGRLPTDGRKGGHLILVTGVGLAGERVEAVRFHDPGRWGDTHDQAPAERFAASFSGRAIEVLPR